MASLATEKDLHGELLSLYTLLRLGALASSPNGVLLTCKLSQSLEQLHHRPRVPFAVVQQVLAHPVVLFRRNLARHKEEPSDFYARHQPVLDHEIVVDQLRDERCRRAWRACGSSLKKGDRRCGPGLRAHVGSDGIRALVDFIQRPARQDPQE